MSAACGPARAARGRSRARRSALCQRRVRLESLPGIQHVRAACRCCQGNEDRVRTRLASALLSLVRSPARRLRPPPSTSGRRRRRHKRHRGDCLPSLPNELRARRRRSRRPCRERSSSRGLQQVRAGTATALLRAARRSRRCRSSPQPSTPTARPVRSTVGRPLSPKTCASSPPRQAPAPADDARDGTNVRHAQQHLLSRLCPYLDDKRLRAKTQPLPPHAALASADVRRPRRRRT